MSLRQNSVPPTFLGYKQLDTSKDTAVPRPLGVQHKGLRTTESLSQSKIIEKSFSIHLRPSYLTFDFSMS